jgi:hypothetical protein
VRVLLSDGSGLTARQAATQLAAHGHAVETLAPDWWCLTRFTSHVRRVHRVPAYGDDPYGWLDAAVSVLRKGRFDVLLPTQEQAALLAREADALRTTGVAIAVPPFAAITRLQDKLSARATLAELDLPQPESTVARSRDELLAIDELPVYVKAPVGTASNAVIRVTSPERLRDVASLMDRMGVFADGGALVQQPAEGPLVMLQAVFAAGDLVAAHANLRVREGANGGASHKRSIELGVMRDHLSRLGGALHWHGGLSLDAIIDNGAPRYIDVNPRLVEPGNAWRSGTDLVGAMLRASMGERPATFRPGRPGVRTHQALLALVGAAGSSGRKGLLAELAAVAARRGDYASSHEELTPLRRDPVAAASLAVITGALLVRPALARMLTAGTVAGYALTPEAWRDIRRGGRR